MRAGLAQLDADGFREGLALLRRVLPSHNDKEDQIVYPAIETVFSDAERALFVERLQKEMS
jgi:hypothetical protein